MLAGDTSHESMDSSEALELLNQSTEGSIDCTNDITPTMDEINAAMVVATYVKRHALEIRKGKWVNISSSSSSSSLSSSSSSSILSSTSTSPILPTSTANCTGEIVKLRHLKKFIHIASGIKSKLCANKYANKRKLNETFRNELGIRRTRLIKHANVLERINVQFSTNQYDNDTTTITDNNMISSTTDYKSADCKDGFIKDNYTHDEKEKEREKKHIICYICKIKYGKYHEFYDKLCPSCAELNWMKRHQTADMTGKICLVTGARVKIGYETALKLLRANAFVIITSRFPKDTILRYSHEVDFHQWSHRLKVYGLDLRCLPVVKRFGEYIATTYDRLDVLIHNAAQTLRRPTVYYKHILENSECKILPDKLKMCVDTTYENTIDNLLKRNISISSQSPLSSLLLGPTAPSSIPSNNTTELNSNNLVALSPSITSSSLSSSSSSLVSHESTASSALLSQMILLPEDQPDYYPSDTFPVGQYDENGQQIDLRRENSWTKKFEEISTVELVEVMAINYFSIILLTQQLLPLLYKTTANIININAKTKEEEKEIIKTKAYIINVSSMEGQFNRNKSIFHVHTNSGKSALNIFTKTSAAEFVTKGVYMNAVDTGYINDMLPTGIYSEKHNGIKFHPPLDEIDGAARILDPIFSTENAAKTNSSSSSTPPYGVFLKDYSLTHW